MLEKPTPFSIRNWSIDDQPREKMRTKGAHYLTNSELLAILIGSGNPGESAVHLMQRLLSSVANDLSDLHHLSLERLMHWKGIGPAKAVKIKAALELGKRIQEREPFNRIPCEYSKQAYQLFKPVLSFLAHEEFWVANLNHQNRVIKYHCMSKGGITSTTVDIRLLMKNALEVGATALLIAHNHPTGHLKPSQSDKALTEKIKNAAILLDIQLCDHLIVSDQNYFSFADEKLL